MPLRIRELVTVTFVVARPSVIVPIMVEVRFVVGTVELNATTMEIAVVIEYHGMVVAVSAPTIVIARRPPLMPAIVVAEGSEVSMTNNNMLVIRTMHLYVECGSIILVCLSRRCGDKA